MASSRETRISKPHRNKLCYNQYVEEMSRNAIYGASSSCAHFAAATRLKRPGIIGGVNRHAGGSYLLRQWRARHVVRILAASLFSLSRAYLGNNIVSSAFL